jgi:hypothetical protein
MPLGKDSAIVAQKTGIRHAYLAQIIFSATPNGSMNRPYNRELWRHFELSHFSIRKHP